MGLELDGLTQILNEVKQRAQSNPKIIRKDYKIKDIKSYLDSCLILGVEVINELSDYDKLLHVIKAANFIDNGNKIWTANFMDDTRKYIPYFERKKSGWVLSDVYIHSQLSFCSVGFYFLKEDTAKIIANNLLPLYNKVLG